MTEPADLVDLVVRAEGVITGGKGRTPGLRHTRAGVPGGRSEAVKQ